jgi:hypothetical protein
LTVPNSVSFKGDGPAATAGPPEDHLLPGYGRHLTLREECARLGNTGHRRLLFIKRDRFTRDRFGDMRGVVTHAVKEP